MRWVLYPLTFLLGLVVLGLAVLALAVAFAWPTLPSLDALTDYHPKIPLRVYTADGALIGEYGDERRAFIHIQDVPPVLKNAILAAEDDRFYQHSGVDLLGILRAAGTNIVTGSKRQGSSTITMQVARNFFLTREKTYSRKLYEILLAFKIEQNLTKDQIRERTMQRIQRLAHYVTSESVDDFQKRMELMSLLDPGLWTRLGVHYGLFLGAIRSGATPNQFSYWMEKGVIACQGMFGCFGMTELAHGSNVAGIETRAEDVGAPWLDAVRCRPTTIAVVAVGATLVLGAAQRLR